MQPAARRNRSFVLLVAIGLVASGAGIGTALYSWLVVMPKVAAVTGEVESSLELADQALAAVERRDGPLAHSLETLRDEVALFSLLPQTFSRLDSVLRSASDTAFFTGRLADEAGEGVSGLVLPDSETAESARALETTAGEMRELASAVDELGHASGVLAADMRELSDDLYQVSPRPTSDAGPLTATRERIHGLREAIARFDLPAMAMFAGVGIGGLYLLVGLLSFALAFALPGRAIPGGVQ